MPIITPDFSEASESSPVPAGVYKARITGVEEKSTGPNSKNPGSPYLNWKLTIFGAEGDFARQNNRILFMMTMLSGGGAGRLKDLAKAALGSVPEPFDTDLLMGKEIEVVVAERFNQDGTPSNFPDVKKVMPVRS